MASVYTTCTIGDNDFRLFKFRPGAKLELEMKTYTVDGAKTPPYFALSYRWGPGHRNLNLSVIGLRPTEDEVTATSPQCNIKITPVLENILKVLKESQANGKLTGRQDSDPGRWFWIDQICINQDDEADKIKQIPNMRDIYDGLKYRNKPGDAQNASTLFYVDVDPPETRDTAMKHLTPKPANTKEELKKLKQENPTVDAALLALCETEYWRRAWMVQEICVSRNGWLVHDGNKAAIPWDHFEQQMTDFYKKKWSTSKADFENAGNWKAVLTHMQMRKNFQVWDSKRYAKTDETKAHSKQVTAVDIKDPSTLAYFFWMANACLAVGCQDERDHVQAIAGLADASQPDAKAKLIADLKTAADSCQAYWFAIRLMFRDYLDLTGHTNKAEKIEWEVLRDRKHPVKETLNKAVGGDHPLFAENIAEFVKPNKCRCGSLESQGKRGSAMYNAALVMADEYRKEWEKKNNSSAQWNKLGIVFA